MRTWQKTVELVHVAHTWFEGNVHVQYNAVIGFFFIFSSKKNKTAKQKRIKKTKQKFSKHHI